jgi:hypothetical protein
MSSEVAPDLHPQARLHLRRNFLLGVTNGVVFSFADALLDTNLVLSVLVSRLSGSSLLVGLLVPINLGGWYLPQLFFSGRIQAAPRKLPYYRTAMAFRLLAGYGMALAAFTLHDLRLLTAVIFIVITASSLAGGLTGLVFSHVVGQTIPSRQRGSFFAWRLLLGGIMALFASFVVRHFVGSPGRLAFPANYAILFALSTTALVISTTAFSLVKEPPDHSGSRRSVWQQLSRSWSLARTHADFARFLAVRGCLMAAEVASPFYILYAKAALGLPESLAATYLMVSTIANIGSTYLWGRVSDHTGNRALLRLVSLAGCVPPLLALVASPLAAVLSGPLEVAIFSLIFAVRGAVTTGAFIGGMNFMLDIAPANERAIYIGLTNTVVGLASFAGALGGPLIAVGGYGALFLLALALYAAAAITISRCAEPRHQATVPAYGEEDAEIAG